MNKISNYLTIKNGYQSKVILYAQTQTQTYTFNKIIFYLEDNMNKLSELFDLDIDKILDILINYQNLTINNTFTDLIHIGFNDIGKGYNTMNDLTDKGKQIYVKLYNLITE